MSTYPTTMPHTLIPSSDVQIFIDGAPLHGAIAVSYEATSWQPAPEPPPPPPEAFTVAIDRKMTAADFAALRELLPLQPPLFRATLPWGILGELTFAGLLDGAEPAREEDGRVVQTFGVSAPAGAFERVIGLALQRCYTPAGEADVLRRAAEDRDPKVRELAAALRGRRYRHARKRKSAMRRLLRAAGVTGARGAAS